MTTPPAPQEQMRAVVSSDIEIFQYTIQNFIGHAKTEIMRRAARELFNRYVAVIILDEGKPFNIDTMLHIVRARDLMQFVANGMREYTRQKMSATERSYDPAKDVLLCVGIKEMPELGMHMAIL